LEGKRGEKCGLYKNIPGAVLRDGFDITTDGRLIESTQIYTGKRMYSRETSEE
jgi:hypothetical protein